MEDCRPYGLPPVDDESGTKDHQCDQLLTGDETKSSARPSLVSVPSISSSRSVGIVEKNLEAAAKLRQIREHKEKHRKKLRENLPPLDELEVKR